LDIDKLYVKEVRIGKSLTLKRSMVRARGRINRIVKPFSKVTIIVEERG
jgi:large subunit ribosomal protein L22